MLARLLEPRTVVFNDSIIVPGHRPRVFHVLTRGMCSVRVRRDAVTDRTLTLMTLRAGQCFGHGCLLDPVNMCPYVAKVAIVVESTTAELQLLPPKSLFLLPDVAVERITKYLETAEEQDPICNDGGMELRNDARWEKQKRKILEDFKLVQPVKRYPLRPRTATRKGSFNLPYRGKRSSSLGSLKYCTLGVTPTNSDAETQPFLCPERQDS